MKGYNMNNNVNGVNVLAISKLVGKKEIDNARESVAPGEYAVNCLLRVSGSLKVGEPYIQKKTASMPQKKMLLAALMLNNVCVESFIKRYLNNEFEVSEEQEEKMEEIWKNLAGKFETEFQGKITDKLNYEVVEEVVV
jgi:hypothetical protein